MNFALSVILISIAGLSTLIGTLLIFISKNKSHKKLGFLLGMASGIMICLCIKELLPESKALLTSMYKYPISVLILIVSMIFGLLLSIILDKLLNHHEDEEEKDEHCKLCNIGITTAFTMALHKVPEGIAIFIAISENYLVAVPLAIAIAIHHIPEGMIISGPIYYATGDKKKALLYSLISGLVLPVSGILGFFLLQGVMNGLVEGIMLGATSSLMLYLTFKEIMPQALKYSSKRMTIFSVMIGIILIYLIELI